MFDADTIVKLLLLLTTSEKLLLASFVNTISEQSQYKNSNLILEFGWKGVDLVSEDFITSGQISSVRVDERNQGAKVNTRGLRKLG